VPAVVGDLYSLLQCMDDWAPREVRTPGANSLAAVVLRLNPHVGIVRTHAQEIQGTAGDIELRFRVFSVARKEMKLDDLAVDAVVDQSCAVPNLSGHVVFRIINRLCECLGTHDHANDR
jgi:hypothetical protein